MDEEQVPAPQDQIADPVIIQNAEGQQFTASGAQALDYLREGYTLAKEQPNFRGVPVRTGTGEVRELAPEEAEQQIRTGLGEVVPRGDLVDYEERQIYESGAGQAAAAAAGLARGATVGLSDVAAGAVDPSLPGGLQRLRQANPGTSLATEIGGNVATLLATGGAAGLGNVAARGAVGLGAAEGGLAARALSGAAIGAAEMGVLEAGQELSQATLQERETSAAKVAEAFGHGALLGGVFGGALPVVGALASGATSAAKRAAGAVAEKVLPGATGEGFVQGVVKQLEDEFAAKSVGAMKKQFREFTGESFARTGAKERAVEMAQEMALQPLERKIAMNAAAAREAGERLSAAVDALSAAGARADVAPVLDGIAAKAAGFAERSGPQFKAAVREAETWAADLRAKAGDGDVKKLLQFKRDLGESTVWKPQMEAFSTPAEALKRDLYHQVDDLIVKTGESTGDDAFREAWRAANRDSQAARWIKGSLEEKLAGQSNRVMGLSEQIGGAVGFMAGGGLNPAGIATAAAGAAIQRVIKSYGADAGTLIARAIRTGDTGAAAAVIDTALNNSVATYLKKGAGAATTAATRAAIPAVSKADADTRELLFGKAPPVDPKRKNLPMAQRVQNAAAGVERGGATPQQVRQAATRLQQSAETQRGRIEEAMRYAPPEVAAVLRGQLAASERVHAYLLSKIPQSSNQKHSLTPQAEGPRMSAAEVAALVTAARVASNPWSVLDSMEKGTLDREEVEALKATAPTVYASLIGAVDTELKARAEPLPYRQAIQLSLLLGVTGDPSLEPSAMRWLQGAFGPPAPPAQQQTPAPSQVAPRGKISAAKDWQIHKEEA